MTTTLSAHGESDNNLPNGAATAESHRFAVRGLRVAALIGLVAPSVEYGRWILHGTRHLDTVAQERESDPELYSEVVSTFSAILIEEGVELIAWAIAGLWLAYPVFYCICSVVHRRVLRRVPESEWWVACNTALWPLPYAATGGVITWFAYWHLFPYGWANDIACGTVGHILGAWCYLTVFMAWFKVARRSSTSLLG